VFIEKVCVFIEGVYVFIEEVYVFIEGVCVFIEGVCVFIEGISICMNFLSPSSVYILATTSFSGANSCSALLSFTLNDVVGFTIRAQQLICHICTF
jgi:hypothetical protein